MNEMDELRELKRRRQELLLKVEYNGDYPNLCSGTLKIKISNREWEINGLETGGSVWFDKNWSEHIEEGPWSINFPDDFPKNYKEKVEEWVNENVSWGCCGGCV